MFFPGLLIWTGKFNVYVYMYIIFAVDNGYSFLLQVSQAEFELVQSVQQNAELRSKIVQSPQKLQVSNVAFTKFLYQYMWPLIAYI